MKKLTVLFVLAAIAIGGIAVWSLRESTNTAQAAVEPAPKAERSQPLGTVDGARNPELIPDPKAYSLLFNLIIKHQTEVEKGRIRSYLKEAGLVGTDADAVIASAEDYAQRVRVLDTQAASINIRTQNNPPPVLTENQIAQLRQLQRQKELLVMSVVSTLHRRLSANGLVKLQQHINERVKRKTKIFPSQPPIARQQNTGRLISTEEVQNVESN